MFILKILILFHKTRILYISIYHTLYHINSFNIHLSYILYIFHPHHTSIYKPLLNSSPFLTFKIILNHKNKLCIACLNNRYTEFICFIYLSDDADYILNYSIYLYIHGI